jgi:hypothetical protein
VQRTRVARIGPLHRPTEFELCVCGVEYTTEWAHLQTGHHKRAERAFRRNQRVKRLNMAIQVRHANEHGLTRRQLRKANGYLTGRTT